MKTFLPAMVCLCSFALFAAPVVNNGDRLLFLGDSITPFGDRPYGYVRLVIDGLRRAEIMVHAIPMGSYGQNSADMLRRMPAVLNRNPEWLLLSCGLNDVGYGRSRVEFPDFKKNVTAILDQAKAAGINVMILTPTTLSEHPSATSFPNSKLLAGYCEFLRQEAANRKLLLADVNKKMQDELAAKKNIGGLKLTIDGFHLNGCGHQMMAVEILEAFGLTPAQIEKYRREWNKIPSMAPIVNNPISPSFLISIDDYEILRAEADKKGQTPEEFARQIIIENIRQAKKP